MAGKQQIPPPANSPGANVPPAPPGELTDVWFMASGMTALDFSTMQGYMNGLVRRNVQ